MTPHVNAAQAGDTQVTAPLGIPYLIREDSFAVASLSSRAGLSTFLPFASPILEARASSQSASPDNAYGWVTPVCPLAKANVLLSWILLALSTVVVGADVQDSATNGDSRTRRQKAFLQQAIELPASLCK